MTKKKQSGTWSLKDESQPPQGNILTQIFELRGITDKKDQESFLYPDYERDIHDPFLFVQMPLVVERVQLAVENSEIVAVFGDHDVDGISSATLMAEGLEKLGLKVEVYIPSKHGDGHGINQKAIDEFVGAGVTLMISVDCGTSNVDEITYAEDAGIDTIVVDHHQPGPELPAAHAIINPHLPGSGYPFADLCGTGCVFKVLQALYAKILPNETEQLKWILDVVAVGTVADCMPLLGENRVLVSYGLMVLAKSRRLAYQKMIEIGEIGKYDGGNITAQTVAFQIAPRLNAAGRMGEARDAYMLMREDDDAMASIRADDLENKNLARRKLTEDVFKRVDKVIKADFMDKKFLFAADESYPIGIVGIVAGRIAQKYGKPTGVFTIEGDTARGSFRSVQGVSIIEILDGSKDTLTSYGGHYAAAGAHIEVENIRDFVAAATSHTETLIKDMPLENVVVADMKIDAAQINHELAEKLTHFEPYGHGNLEPLFWITGLEISALREVGKTGKHLKVDFRTESNGDVLAGIGFGLAGSIDEKSGEEIAEGDQVEILATIGENIWQGKSTVQASIKHWRKAQ